jgi:hypothetical protein
LSTMTNNNTKHGLSKNAEIQYYVKRDIGRYRESRHNIW